MAIAHTPKDIGPKLRCFFSIWFQFPFIKGFSYSRKHLSRIQPPHSLSKIPLRSSKSLGITVSNVFILNNGYHHGWSNFTHKNLPLFSSFFIHPFVQASVHASGGAFAAFRCRDLRGGHRSGAGRDARGGGRCSGVVAVDGELPDAASRSAQHLAPAASGQVCCEMWGWDVIRIPLCSEGSWKLDLIHPCQSHVKTR